MKRIGITIDIENQYYLKPEDDTLPSKPCTKIGCKVENNGDSYYSDILINTPEVDDHLAFEAVCPAISDILGGKLEE